MSSNNDSPRASTGPPSFLPLNLGSRRGSLASLTGSVDKEQLSQALDKIHSTACQSDTLTTFNEFAPPPSSSSTTEHQGIAGDIIHNGFSGLYSRFKTSVGVGGKEKSGPGSSKGDTDSIETGSVKSMDTPTSKRTPNTSREDSGATLSPVPQSTSSSSRLQSPTTSSFTGLSTEGTSQMKRSSKNSLASSSNPSVRPSIAPMTKATTSSATVPTVAPINVNAFKDGDKPGAANVDPHATDKGAKTPETMPFAPKSAAESLLDDSDSDDPGLNSLNSSQIKIGSGSASTGNDGNVDVRRSSTTTAKTATSALSSLKASDQKPGNSTRSDQRGPTRRPTAIERITQSHLPGYQASRASSTDRSIAEASPIHTSAHNSVQHEMFSPDESSSIGHLGRSRIPGTTTNEGAPEMVSARLEQMRKQVLSKEFWMADGNAKECFQCGDAFSVLRRKHHCRTCGSIFDSKCTSIISAQKFGVQGTLRVCKTCLDIVNNRHDSSGSDDSDDASLPTFFQSQQAKFDSASKADATDLTLDSDQMLAANDAKSKGLATPMMAIPATRRVGDSANRQSLVLDIDGPQLARPGSARSLKTTSMGGRPASSGHKRHSSKHGFLGRFKPTIEERAPFQRGIGDDGGKRSHLPAFHDDSIIDPDMAPYMSDEESSADEQPSIFATMSNSGVLSPSFENDRSGFGSLLSASKRHRARNGEKSVSGISFTSRGMDQPGGAGSMGGHVRPNRRRNLSAASNNLHLTRTSPRPMVPGFGSLNEEIASSENSGTPTGTSRMIRSASMRDSNAPEIELNAASLQHVRRLLHQLLEDAGISHITAWEKALIPILLRCTDDVDPDVKNALDDIDIRHFVKVKRIPGARPGDTSYISGVVFTKNLALKSMPRSILYPRIVIVSFPIEYQRHQHHFMSLEPVIAQEKEFLQNMVNRIASLRPQLLLCQKHISGLALQYLEEANIAVVYNVKPSVIEAVARCAHTEVISSIDMVALKPVHIGKCDAFEVKTFVHPDIPGKKKTFIYLSGCSKERGCTIALRGANLDILTKMKRITEFMVYVVYNLKLETCLMRDELVMIPSTAGNSGSISPLKLQSAPPSVQSVTSHDPAPVDTIVAASNKLEAGKRLEQLNIAATTDKVEDTRLSPSGPLSGGDEEIDKTSAGHIVSNDLPPTTPKLVSAHASHAHGSHEDQLPEDIPMPTFYSDMAAKHETKILSASPFVKFVQPYLLMKARSLERQLVYLKRLRDQDTFEDQPDEEKSKPEKFQLIKPEMVYETVKSAPRQLMEVLHAVHDAEYDKAMHNYLTQKRQWETHVSMNSHLFDPYTHQTITTLYSVVCTSTSIPCYGPDLLSFDYYNQHEVRRPFDPDCTLGQYVEDLCTSINTICTAHGCERKMSEHHRTYVHGEAKITVVLVKSPCKLKGMHDQVLMWSYCKICDKEKKVLPMSEGTWKYSFGKYLELSFWSSQLGLRKEARPDSDETECQHDIHRDHLRYFGYRNVALRIHYDPIDLLEIVVPRSRITWKVDNDLRLKNDIFTKFEERWNRYMNSVKSRIKGINIDGVASNKAEACKAEVERMTKMAQDDHLSLTRKLQAKYMDSKYYEVVPLNRALRAMQERVVNWDEVFSQFDSNFFPSEKDIRRLAALQLKKMFMDRDESTTSLTTTTESSELVSDVDEKSPSTSLELTRQPSQLSADEAHDVLTSVVVEVNSATQETPADNEHQPAHVDSVESQAKELDAEGIEHLDLAVARGSETIPPTPAESGSTETIDTPDPEADDVMGSPRLAPHEGRTLSEKVEQLRRESLNEQSEASGIPRPSGGSRRGGLATSPPLNRAQSQPTGSGTIRRVKPNSHKSYTRSGGDNKQPKEPLPPIEPLKTSATEPLKPTDKKLSERLGIGGTLRSKKNGSSLIPRSVTTKRKETKVSTLAKHFEQLSREFEKERLKDRRQRAAKVSQSRHFPKATSRPVIEVYKDVNDAVEERGYIEEHIEPIQPAENVSTIEGLTDITTGMNSSTAGPLSPLDTTATAEETATEAETDDNHHYVSQTASDDDGAVSDADHSLLDDLIPGTVELGDSLQKPENDISLEMPKHEKTSLMKMLTNFWAERSASGWTPLDYPIGISDHIFADNDVVVREDEPSSLIAFTLQSLNYQNELTSIRNQGYCMQKGERQQTEMPPGHHDICEDGVDQAEVETSLLRSEGTHISLSFADGSATMQCKIFYAEQFDAVRRKCGVADRIVESLSRCLKWDSKGGKTKSVFLKTLDDRLVLKSLSSIETQAFLKFAPAYFNIMAEALFHELPSVIAKMLGFYQITLKNPATGIELKLDLLLMENLFYDRAPDRIFDLKGSMRNRKIQSTGEQNEVLLDENMVEFIYESPLFTREVSPLSLNLPLPTQKPNPTLTPPIALQKAPPLGHLQRHALPAAQRRHGLLAHGGGGRGAQGARRRHHRCRAHLYLGQETRVLDQGPWLRGRGKESPDGHESEGV